MTSNPVEQWLENDLGEFPQRASGEELYERMVSATNRFLPAHRDELIQALACWLGLRTEPRTMLAIEIAAAHGLNELRPAIEDVLRDVRQGAAFRPFYEKPILNALAKL